MAHSFHDVPVGFRWRVTGETKLPVTASLPAARAARAALMHAMNRFGLARLPDDFHHGTDGKSRSAYWLPEDEDEDGTIDHILLVHLDGLPEAHIAPMALGGDIHFGDRERWRLAPVWMGPLGAGGLFGPARIWVSQSPFVTPLPTDRVGSHGKPARPRPGRSLTDQVVKALADIGQPAPAAIDLHPVPIAADQMRDGGTRVIRAAGFALEGLGHERPQLGAEAAFVRLHFHEAILGPVALGFGANSGIGLFQPMDDAGAQ